MSSQTFIHAKPHTNMKNKKQLKYYFLLVVSFLLYTHSLFAWEIDFSRRTKYLQKQTETQALPQTPVNQLVPALLTTVDVVQSNQPLQEVVILNTEKGFVPQSIPLKKGIRYKLSVVNINEKEKNVSFILNTFNQHHGTYYGQIKSFEITPNLEGVYTFQCPETSLEGHMVVVPNPSDRGLATEN